MSRKTWSFIVVTGLLIAVTIYSAITGSIKIGVMELLKGLINGDNDNVEIILDLRFPRIIVAIFTGAALAVSGVLLQAVMRNPLADAGVIGISAGAGMVSLLVVGLVPTLFFWVPLFAVIGGAIACILVFSLSWKSGLNPIRLILVGIAINATFTGVSQLLGSSGGVTLNSSGNNALGSVFTMQTWSNVQIMVIYGSIGLVLAMLMANWCNLLAMNDKTVRNLGLRVNRARVLISAVAVLLASAATAIGGLIAFVGLLIPHIARILVGSEHKLLLPFSALAGALLILTADTIGRTIMAPIEVPASIIMTVIGGPFFIFLLRRSGRIYGS